MLRGQFLLVVYYLHITTIIYYQSALSGSLPACSSHITCCQKTGSTITSSAVGFHTHTLTFFSPSFCITFAIFCLRYIVALFVITTWHSYWTWVTSVPNLQIGGRALRAFHMTKNRAVNLRKAWNLECDWPRGWQCFDAHDNH